MILEGINLLAVFIAGITNMVIGMIWYGPLFGRRWMTLMKFNEKELNKAKENDMTVKYVLAFLASLLMAIGLAYAVKTSPEGILIAFWIWLTFISTVLLNGVLWEGKPVRLYLINIAYHLVSLLAMAAIITLWR